MQIINNGISLDHKQYGINDEQWIKLIKDFNEESKKNYHGEWEAHMLTSFFFNLDYKNYKLNKLLTELGNVGDKFNVSLKEVMISTKRLLEQDVEIQMINDFYSLKLEEERIKYKLSRIINIMDTSDKFNISKLKT